MTEQNENDPANDRRSMPRHPSRADALLFRETDAMRIGIPGRVVDVCVDGLGLRIETEIGVGEELRVELSNPVQRFKKSVRGIVRHCGPTADKQYRIGIELQTRLTPPEVQMLRTNRPDSAGDASTWV